MDPRQAFLAAQKKKAATNRADRNQVVMSRELDELRSIMVRDQRQAHNRADLPATGQMQYAQSLTNKTMQTVIDSENIIQLLPEIELAIQVLISQILSPKDLITVSLIYETSSDTLGEVSALLNKVVSEHMEKDYKIIDKLKDILRQTLFETGSKPLAVIPRSRIDSIINSGQVASMESFGDIYNVDGSIKNIGVIGNSGKTLNPKSFRELATENFSSSINPGFDPVVARPEFNITVSDNHDLLKIGGLMEKIREDRTARLYGSTNTLATESLDLDMNTVYKPKLYRQATVLDLTDRSATGNSDDDGDPLVFDFPSESVFSVFPPSNPSKHLGYYVVLDENGQFVKKASVGDFYRQMQRGSQGSGQTSQMLERMRGSLTDYSGGMIDADAMTHIFSKVVEEDLVHRFKNGVNAGSDAAIGYSEEVRRIMFARACMQMKTQLLFIPTMYMTYFAFDYTEHGIGKSLVENTKLLASYRAIAGMANIFAMIKNSVNYRKVTLGLDPKDPDPDRTIEFALHELARQTSGEFPIGEQNPSHIATYLQNAGVSVAVTGHPRIPQTTIEIDSAPANNVQVNTELEELLENRHNAALGIPTEAINSAADVNYVAQILQSNLLCAKRAIRHQETFCPQLTDHIRKYTIAHGGLMKKLTEVVSKNRKALAALGVTDKNTDRQIVLHHLNNLNITLPKPDFNQLAAQLEEFKAYSEQLDLILSTTITSDIFGTDANTQLSSLGESTDLLKSIFKSYLERKWLKDRGIMPEVFELFADLKKEDTVLQKFLYEHKDLADGIREVAKKLIATNHNANKETDEFLSKITEDNSDSAGEGGDGGGGDSDDSSDKSDGDSDGQSSDGDDFSDDFSDDSADSDDGDSGDGDSEESDSSDDSKPDDKGEGGETKDDKAAGKEADKKADDAFSTDD